MVKSWKLYCLHQWLLKGQSSYNSYKGAVKLIKSHAKINTCIMDRVCNSSHVLVTDWTTGQKDYMYQYMYSFSVPQSLHTQSVYTTGNIPAVASNLQYLVLFMTFQYFSTENLAYYAPIMLILKPKLQYFLQYFASKISTSTEESVWLEALVRILEGGRCIVP